MKKAFTLIELLVVIAIIAILAAILFPVFAQAKLAAKKTVSLSNIKQNALGVTMYNADGDDNMPSTMEGGYDSSPTPSTDFNVDAPTADLINSYWASSTQPYVKNWDLLKDAAMKQINPFNYTAKSKQFTYSFNGYLHLYNATAVTSPAKAIAFWMSQGNNTMTGYAHSWPQPYPGAAGGFPKTEDQASWRFLRNGTGCTKAAVVSWGAGYAWTDFDYRAYGNQAVMAYVDGHAKTINVYSNDYPYVLDKTTGKLTAYWTNTDDSKAGCGYFSKLAPTIE